MLTVYMSFPVERCESLVKFFKGSQRLLILIIKSNRFSVCTDKNEKSSLRVFIVLGFASDQQHSHVYWTFQLFIPKLVVALLQIRIFKLLTSLPCFDSLITWTIYHTNRDYFYVVPPMIFFSCCTSPSLA